MAEKKPQPILDRQRCHQTREDRQRKAYDVLQVRIRDGRTYQGGGRWHLCNVQAAERDAANLARKLNIQV
jgi:hypothetical protein